MPIFAGIQIPNLPPLIALNGTEQLECVQAGTSSRLTVNLIKDYVITHLPSTSTPSTTSDIIAVPGGSTDVTAALQASIDAAEAAGVSLIMPAGIYTITPAASGGLKIRYPLTIIANPNARIVAKTGSYSNCDMVNIQSSNVTIDGGVWDWGSQAGSSNFIVNIVGPGYTFITLRRGTYKNAVYGCVQSQDCSFVSVNDNNTFTNNQGGDVNIICAGANVDCVVARNNIHSCPASNYEAINVVNLSGGTKTLKNILIIGNKITGSSAPSVGSCAIQVWANAANYNPGPVICNDNIVFGFAIGYSLAFCTDGSCTGNVATSCSLIGYEMAGSGLACSGDVCEGNQITQYGFTTDGAPRNVFSGCAARNCTLYSYSVTNTGSFEALFVGCHAYQSAAAHTGSAFAIFGLNGVTLSGCHVDYGAVSSGPPLGVYAVDVGNLTITGSYFNMGSASLTFGNIYLDNSTGTVRNNIKIKTNSFVSAGAIPNGNVRLIGTSYGANVDVEGMTSVTVTQSTSKSTAIASTSVFQVDITMNGAALNAATVVSFSWPNIFMAAGDRISVDHISGGTLGAYTFNAVAGALSGTIYVRNASAGSLSEAIVLRCILTKNKAV